MNQNDTITKQTNNLIDKINSDVEQTDMPDSSDPSQHKSMTKTYTIILFLLFIITIAEYIFGSSLAINNRTKFLVLIIFALIKASAIIAYFMHVKYDKHRVWIIFGSFLFPLVITLPIAFFPIIG